MASKDSCVERLHDNSLATHLSFVLGFEAEDTSRSNNGKVQAESKLAGLQEGVEDYIGLES